MRILVVAGASGGHIYPALSFLSTLESKHRDIRTLFVLPRRGMGGGIVSRERPVRFISTVPLVLRPPRKACVSFFSFLKGCGQSLDIMITFRPDIVVGFGTLDSIPLIFLGWAFRVKTLIHEQNVVAGHANIFLSRIADKVAVSFKETCSSLHGGPGTCVLTGNPLRPGLKRIERGQALKFFGFDEGRTTILVVGGSQGSSRINEASTRAFAALPDKDGFQVIHIAGPSAYAAVADQYQGSGVKARVLGYLDQMEFAYSICDLAVSRAGATTVAELTYFKIPAILIPYPFARAHQAANAQALENAKASLVILEKNVDAALYGTTLQMLISSPGLLARMRAAYDTLPERSSAAQTLVDVALSLLKQ